MPSNRNEIATFLHCSLCIHQLPTGISPAEYARLAFGWTPNGLQVWCQRHDVNVMHIDFEGKKLPANTTRHTDN